MRDLARSITELLDSDGVPALRDEARELRSEILALMRERAEVGQRIPFWDRVIFFSDTPDEQHAKGLDAQLRERRSELAAINVRLHAAHEAAAARFPPFALAIAIDDAVRLAIEGLQIRGLIFKSVDRKDDLDRALEAAGQQLLDLYIPGADIPALIRRLAERERFEDTGVSAELDGDPRLGFAPIRPGELEAAMALELARCGFLDDRDRVRRLSGERDDLARAYKEARERVPFIDKVNVFTDSPAEKERDRLKLALDSKEEEARRAFEATRKHIHAALAVFPPLLIFQGLAEALGIAGLLSAEKVGDLKENGALTQRTILAPRVLVFAAFHRLQQTLEDTFPGMPAPWTHREAPADPRDRSLAPVVDAFVEDFQAGPGPELCARALAHAATQGQLSWQLRQVRRGIAIIDRLVFWSDTEAETREDALEERHEWSQSSSESLWRSLIEGADEVCDGIGPLALKRRAIEASRAIAAIHTDSGESSFPKSCSVYGRGEAQSALAGIRDTLAGIYGVAGSRMDTMMRVAEVEPVPTAVERGGRHLFEPLTSEQLCASIAAQIKDLDAFRDNIRVMRSENKKLEALEGEKAAVEERISLWDRINIFTTTPDEAQRNELKAEIKSLSETARTRYARADEEFERAASSYPPAVLKFRLNEAIDAVGRIRAVCRRRTVTTGSGKNKRTETRYYCALEGHSRAVNAMKRWAAAFVRDFGALPDSHRLLEVWQLRACNGEPEAWDEGAEDSEANPEKA